jgi:hypothetical protein
LPLAGHFRGNESLEMTDFPQRLASIVFATRRREQKTEYLLGYSINFGTSEVQFETESTDCPQASDEPRRKLIPLQQHIT